MPRAAHVLVLFAVAAALLHQGAAFYLPGVAPHVYKKGENLNIKVQSLTSQESALQFDYYQLPFCHPKDEVEYAENLGEALLGEKSMSSPYHAKALQDMSCQVACRKVYNAKEMEEFQDFTILNYRVNMRADNLPLAEVSSFVYSDNPNAEPFDIYSLGYNVGYLREPETGAEGEDTYFINNHLKFTIQYHPVEKSQDDIDPADADGVFIVGFRVEPFSIKHHYSNEWQEDCEPGDCKLDTCGSNFESAPRLQITTDSDMNEIIWTYDVSWQKSDIKWVSRWDIYLKLSDDRIHWFSIVNSTIVVIFLTVIVAMIMTKILRKDFAMYDELAEGEDGEVKEDSGWKLVYGDVFRTPTNPSVLTALLGQGFQLLLMVIATLAFAILGFLSPANRGALASCVILFYVILGFSSGYIAARFCKLFKEPNQFRVTVLTGTLVPGLVFAMFFLINTFVWVQGSSGAVPFGTMVALCLLWFGVSFPLVFFGSYLGFKKEGYEVPVRTNPIPRQIPPVPLYLQKPVLFLVSGILPFGVIFVELAVILGSLWLHRFYYMFGFLALCFFLLLVTITEVAIVTTYLLLCAEDYLWWWRSWLGGGSTAFYIFLYSVHYYAVHVHTAGLGGMLSFGIHMGYTLILSGLLFVLFGFVGTCSSFLFARKIYGSIKID